MIKWLLSSILIVGVMAGCSSGTTPVEQIEPVSRFNAYVDTQDASPVNTDAIINPILQDSIITLEEQEKLVSLIENLLQELAYYKRLYYLRMLQ